MARIRSCDVFYVGVAEGQASTFALAITTLAQPRELVKRAKLIDECLPFRERDLATTTTTMTRDGASHNWRILQRLLISLSLSLSLDVDLESSESLRSNHGRGIPLCRRVLGF
jgi:hypothetical protein